MKRVTIADIAASAAVITLVAVTLMPAVARIQRTPADAKCQSNLRRWSEAMELYLSDNYGCYPVNLFRHTTPMATIILAPTDPIPPATEPPPNTWGATWVEALYSYLKTSAARTDQDWKSFRRCPNAKDILYPRAPANGTNLNWAMSYVFNGTLAHRPSALNHNAEKLMMIREFGRITISTLRPSNVSIVADPVGNPSSKPLDPFLHDEDMGITSIGGTSGECQLHGNGSYILFADGHVAHFDLSYYPESRYITAAVNYDPATAQWWNRVYQNPATPDEVAHNKAIAITP